MKKPSKNDKAMAFVCKETGLTEVEVKSLVKQGATAKDIMAAATLKKFGLGIVRI